VDLKNRIEVSIALL